MLVSADIGVWAIFIIISVVAQIIKARKKAATQAPKPPAPKGGSLAAAQSKEELRQFLETLAGGSPQRTAPAEVKPPARPQVVPPRPPPTPRQVPPQPKPAATPPPTPRTRDAQPAKAEKQPAIIASALQNLLREELQGESIQKAIVLREILGPPIGLKARDRRG